MKENNYVRAGNEEKMPEKMKQNKSITAEKSEKISGNKPNNFQQPRRKNNNQNNNSHNAISELWRTFRIDNLFFLAIFVLVGYAVLSLMQPFINPVIIAIILAFISYPLFNKIKNYLKNNILASALTIIIVVLVIFMPIAYLGYVAVEQGSQLIEYASSYNETHDIEKEIVDNVLALNQNPTVKTVSEFFNADFNITEQDLNTYYAKTLGTAKEYFKHFTVTFFSLVASIGSLLFNFLIIILTMSLCYTQGDKLLNYLKQISPMPKSYKDKLLNRIKQVTHSAVVGTVVVATMQGTIAFCAFLICGIKSPFFLSVLMGFCSMIPIVGTGIVLLPLIVFLVLTNKIGIAIFIFIWCILLNSVVDYIIRPRLLKGNEDMPATILLFSILGGVAKFGILGFVYGPVLFGIMSVLLWIYQEKNRQLLKSNQ